MRTKEFAHDYRYFPDPDLLPLELTDEYLAGLAAGLPELPDEKKARFVAELGLSPYDAQVLAAERETADYFEQAAKGRDAKQAANWVTGALFAHLNDTGKSITESPVKADALGGLLDLVADGTISGRIAKDVFADMAATGKGPKAIVDAKGLTQISDAGAIEAEVDKAIAANPEQAQEVRDGKAKTIGWLVGQVMKATGGKANPKMVNDLLVKKLKG